jgi:hypothetical protein
MDRDHLNARCVVTDCLSGGADRPDRLAAVVVFDQPFDAVALDEAVFSLSAQDHEPLEVVVVLPTTGPTYHRRAEEIVRGQSWPDDVSARVVSVPTRSDRLISADLLNAGLDHSTARYVAYLHHQDVVYQHAYPALIARLQETRAAVAFGGVRTATHTAEHRHWMVAHKLPVAAHKNRSMPALDGQGAIHSFVADRERLAPDELTAGPSGSRYAATLWLLRLALHPKADFALAGKPMVESRVPPHRRPTDLGRVPPAAELLAAVADGGVKLLDPAAVRCDALMAELLRAVVAC